jgi:hypothetical protein
MDTSLQGPDDGNQLMFEAIVAVTTEVAPHLFALLKDVVQSNHQIEAKLATLDKKLDAILLRELTSALQMIDGLAAIASERMKAKHLDDAESNLLKSITLDPSATIAGHKSSYWSAQSYYGLACIALLRGERHDGARFLLQTFLVCPKEARERLAPELYRKAMEPDCREIVAGYNEQLKRVPQYEEQIRQLTWQLRKKQFKLAGIMGVGIAMTLLASNPGQRMSASRASVIAKAEIDREIAAIKRTLDSIPTRSGLAAAFEHQLDEKCKEIAQRLLEAGNSEALV